MTSLKVKRPWRTASPPTLTSTLVYTINEPAAFGAATAIRNAGLEDQITIVSVDGGCAGVQGVVNGEIAATSQQYPLEMASLGVETIFDVVANGAQAPFWLHGYRRYPYH